MTTTQSTPESVPKPRRELWPVFAGLALAPLVFALGAFALLPAAALSLLPKARLRALGLAWVGGGLVCLLASLAGVNPVMYWARETALARLENISGERPTFDDFSASPGSGTLRFSGLKGALSEGAGEYSARELSIELGLGFLGAPRIEAEGLSIAIAPESAGFVQLRKRLNESESGGFSAELSDVRLDVKGAALSAVVHAKKVNVTRNGALEAIAAPDFAEITVNRQMHRIELLGNVRVGKNEKGFSLQCDMPFSHQQYGRGVLQGTLRPDFKELGLRATLDHFEIAPIWARYAQWSEFKGEILGVIDIAGDFDKLTLRSHLTLAELDYFHSTAMEMDRARSFKVPQAEISGDVEILAGGAFAFRALTATSPDCAIATDPAMNARGAVKIVADGVWPDISAQCELTAKGKIEAPLEFTRTGKPLTRYQPNGVQLIELLPSITANVKVKVEELNVRCDSLTGTLKGELEVKLTKRKGEPFASVRAGGELQLSEGQFDFCAAKGSAVGTVVFNPNVPPIEASVRGTLTGKAGEVPLDVEVTGRLSDPGLIFKHVNMRPQDLGKVIATAGADKLSPAERAAWTLKLSLTFGVFAANHQNPFEGQDLGEIFFSFRAGE